MAARLFVKRELSPGVCLKGAGSTAARCADWDLVNFLAFVL